MTTTAPRDPSRLWVFKTKSSERKEPIMRIIGCDYHPSFQQICMVDTETGEITKRRCHRRMTRDWQFGQTCEVRLFIAHVTAAGGSKARMTPSRRRHDGQRHAECIVNLKLGRSRSSALRARSAHSRAKSTREWEPKNARSL